MLGYSTIKGLIQYLLNGNIVTRVYHSVTMQDKGGKRYPAYKVGDDFFYVGIDDTKRMSCYLRQTGAMVVGKSEFFTGSAKAYYVTVPYRLVFFNDFEGRNFDELTAKILQGVFLPGITLIRYYNDGNELMKVETSPELFRLGGTSFYKAVDLAVSFWMKPDNCEMEVGCTNIENPITEIKN